MNFVKSIKIILNAIHAHPLASKHKISAYYNLAKWQVVQLFSPGIKKIKFIGDTLLLVNKGMTGATGNIYCGLHDFEDMGFLIHFLREGDLFIDIGSNVGSYTVIASGFCKANSIAFEPLPETYQSLKNNIEINNISDLVILKNAAVGSQIGIIKFTTNFDTVNHVLASTDKSDEDFINVNVVVLDNELKNEISTATIIKIDVEGFETEVLNGMNITLQNKNVKAIIIELNNSGQRYGYDESKIHEKLLVNDFHPYAYNPFDRSLTKLNNHLSTNTIYIKDFDFVNQRLSTGKKVNIFSETF